MDIFNALDTDKSGEISINEFFDTVLDCCLVKGSADLKRMEKQIEHMHWRLKETFSTQHDIELILKNNNKILRELHTAAAMVDSNDVVRRDSWRDLPTKSPSRFNLDRGHLSGPSLVQSLNITSKVGAPRAEADMKSHEVHSQLDSNASRAKPGVSKQAKCVVNGQEKEGKLVEEPTKLLCEADDLVKMLRSRFEAMLEEVKLLTVRQAGKSETLQDIANAPASKQFNLDLHSPGGMAVKRNSRLSPESSASSTGGTRSTKAPSASQSGASNGSDGSGAADKSLTPVRQTTQKSEQQS